MKKQILIIATAVVIVGSGVIGLSLLEKDGSKQPAPSSQDTTQQQTPNNEVSYKGEDSKDALTLLRQSHKIEAKSYEGLGELVTSIDGVASDSKHFWAFYVNGQPSQIGAGAYITKSSETITWKLDEIK